MTAIEVAMSPQGEINNIKKDFQAGWGHIVVACRDKSVLKRVQQEWSEIKDTYPPDTVEIILLNDPLFNSNDKTVSTKTK